MHAFAVLALAGAAVAIPAAPASPPPAGCQTSYNGHFTIQVINATTAGAKSKRQTFEPPQTSLDLTLANGVMMDKFQRTGYIASNHQFQFDTGAQPGALYTSGFSVCPNNSIAIGGNALFYACKVDTYYNLYDSNVNNNCGPVFMDATPISGGGSGGEQSDGQPTVTGIGEKTDGQPTATGIGEKTDGQPTVTAIMQSAPAGEKTDGQPTVTAIQSSPVGEKTDGQPTVTAIATSPAGEKTDGQPTVTAILSSPVGEKTDGQPTVTAISNATSVVPITNAAATPKVEMLALGAAALAAALL